MIHNSNGDSIFLGNSILSNALGVVVNYSCGSFIIDVLVEFLGQIMDVFLSIQILDTIQTIALLSGLFFKL